MCPDVRHHFKNPTLADMAEVHLKRGQINQLLASYDESSADLRHARLIAEASGDQGLVIKSRTREIHLCYLMGHQEMGLAVGQLVLGHPAIGQFPADEAQANNSLGNVHLRRFEIELAEASFGRARIIYQKLGDQFSEARVVCNLANISNVRGDNNKALELYRHALDIFEQHGDPYSMAHASWALGQVQLDMGDWEGARASLGRALQLSGATQDFRRQSSCLLVMADIDNNCGQFQDALRHIWRGREIAVEHGIKDPSHWALIHGKEAETFHNLERWEDAQQAVRQMLDIAEPNRYLTFQAEGYSLLGLVTVKKTRERDGLESIARGIALAREHQLDYQLLSGQAKMAEAYSILGQREQAVALFKECVQLGRKVGTDIAPILREIDKLEAASTN